jgi:adenylate cyclase class IV
MATEIEIKYKVLATNVDRIKDLLAKYETKGRKYENNIMFDNDQKTMDSVDARLRVRLISETRESQEKHIQLTYKRRLSVENGIKKEEEIEVEFDTNAKDFIEILNKMGYKRTTSYERFRETFVTPNHVKVTLDEFPYGVVLEIEGEEADVLSLETDLGLTSSDRYALSCDDLYRELCQKEGKEHKQDISFDDPDMPKY